MKRPFTFAEEALSHDTIQLCRTILERAESGELIGIACTIMNKKRSYNVETAGELDRNPTYAIGTVVVLLYKLIKKVVH